MDDPIERTGICGFDHENRKYTKGTFGQRRFPLFCLSADMSCVKISGYYPPGTVLAGENPPR